MKIRAYSAETLKLFTIRRWSTHKHLDEVQDQDDRAELDRILLLFNERNAERQACNACKISHGTVCDSHYHDYALCGDEGCWTCYVSRVLKEDI